MDPIVDARYADTYIVRNRTMKTTCLCIVFLLLFGGTGFGVPYLVSDPYPNRSDKPVKFIVTINGNSETTAAAKNPDGSVYLKYDLANCEDGAFTASVKAVDAKGVESQSASLSFKKSGPTVEVITIPQSKEKIPPSRQYNGHLKFAERSGRS